MFIESSPSCSAPQWMDRVSRRESETASKALNITDSGEAERFRITFVVRSLAIGGAERQLVNLSRGLAERGHDVTVVVLSRNVVLAAPLQGGRVRLVCYEKRGRWHAGGWIKGLLTELRDRRPDLVCGWKPAEGLMAYPISLMAGRVPFLWSVRASNVNLRDYDWFTGVVFKLHRVLARAGLGHGIIFNSYAGASAYGLEPDEACVRVIWNAIDTNQFYPSSKLRQACREELGLTPNQPAILILGRLIRVKDHSTFLRAARIVSRELPNAIFLIVGDGNPVDRDRIAREVNDAGLTGAVRLTGTRMDVGAILNAADVVVSTSRESEGVQNSLMEAMACGRPIVATRVGDAPQFLSRRDSLVPVGDEAAVAREVLRQLQQDGPEMRTERAARAAELFGLDRACREMESVIRSVQRARVSR